MRNQGTLTPESAEGSRFIIESETSRDGRKRAGAWKSGVRESAWRSARDAHFGRFRACHYGGDADDDDARTLTPMVIDPCEQL